MRGSNFKIGLLLVPALVLIAVQPAVCRDIANDYGGAAIESLVSGIEEVTNDMSTALSTDFQREIDDVENNLYPGRRQMLRGWNCQSGPCSIAAGASHTCAIMATGSVRCWGLSLYGQLGYQSIESRGDKPGTMPPPDVNLGGDVVQISAGYAHTCVLMTESRSVRCWGWGKDGRLGYGHQDSYGSESEEGKVVRPMPPPEVNLGAPVFQVTCGYQHTCARMVSGAVKCWGANERGQLGYGNTESIGDEPGEMPPPDVNVGGKVKQLSAGSYFTCAMMDETRSVRCWGDGRFGQAGDTRYLIPTQVTPAIHRNFSDMVGDQPNEMPPEDINVGGRIAAVSAGGFHTCVIMEATGSLKCFGDNRFGQLGYENIQNVGGILEGDMPPKDVDIGGRIVRQVYSGTDKTCVILQGQGSKGGSACWGHGSFFQLGNGYDRNVGDHDATMPPDIHGFNHHNLTVMMIDGGQYHTCAVVMPTPAIHGSNATVKCWGSSNWGQLGYESTETLGQVIKTPLPTPDVDLGPTVPGADNVMISIPPPP
eukprot:CAMPEP_0197863546 /NCGR_PEP_ID=MMETSP1438-20131217/41070_1 /TAXON_ID=1461541 /ORGANISM="Pterosperma sp., Strain CCMP1384" /LENGTH=536 /DNA_ID=CAMNT_0043481479 /DNA_START=124 /DNA_END=1730 /DNA_ORIENTATION=-